MRPKSKMYTSTLVSFIFEHPPRNCRFLCFLITQLLTSVRVELFYMLTRFVNGFNTVRLVTKAMRDSHGPVVFRNLCPPQSTVRKSAAKVFYHLLGE